MVKRLFAALGTAWLCASTPATHAGHPLTPADALATEDVGHAQFAMHGRVLLYERIPPFRQAANTGALDGTWDRSVLAQIYYFDLERAEASQPLFEHEADRSCWLGALSPDTTRLAFYCLRNGRLSAGVYDLASRRVRHFAFTPNYLERIARTPVWISNDEVVYPALPDGAYPTAAYRMTIAARLNELWGKAFAGREPSTTVLRSSPNGIDNSLQMRPGMLVRIDVRSGQETAFGSGYFYNLRLAPGGRWLAALREGGEIQPPLEGPPMGIERTFRELIVFDLRTGASLLPCPGCHVGLGSVNWSADGTILTFLARQRGEPLERSRLYRQHIGRGALERVDTRDIHLGCGAFRPTTIRSVGIGAGVAIFAAPATPGDADDFEFTHCQRGPRRDWLLLSADRKPHAMTQSLRDVQGELLGLGSRSLFVLADNAVWEVSRDASPRKVTTGVTAPLTPWSVGPAAALSRSREDTFTSPHIPLRHTVLESEQEIVTVDLLHRTTARLPRPRPGALLLDVAPSGGLAVFREDSAHGTALLLTSADATRTLELLNPHFTEIELPAIATMEHDAPGGTRLSSCLFLPPRWTAAKRYPMIVDVYPDNPAPSCDSDFRLQQQMMSPRWLAGHGYIVLSPATPRELTKTSEGPMKALTRVVLSAVDEAVARGYADPQRLGVFGFSQGFTSAVQVLTDTTRFRAAVVGNGVGDFASHFGTISLRDRMAGESVQGAPVGNFLRYELDYSPMYLGSRPWDNPARFAANSPTLHAQAIDAPLLIFHSDFDGFPLGQSEQLFSALYRLRKEAVYVTYWGEGHGNTSPANVEDLWQRIFAWYDSHL